MCEYIIRNGIHFLLTITATLPNHGFLYVEEGREHLLHAVYTGEAPTAEVQKSWFASEAACVSLHPP